MAGRLSSLHLHPFDLAPRLHWSRSVSFHVTSGWVHHKCPALLLHSLSPPPAARQNDNSIDVKCVAFGPLEHVTPACLARPPPCFMALLCPLLCAPPTALGWAVNNLENLPYVRLHVCWHVCSLYVRINRPKTRDLNPPRLPIWGKNFFF